MYLKRGVRGKHKEEGGSGNLGKIHISSSSDSMETSGSPGITSDIKPLLTGLNGICLSIDNVQYVFVSTMY